MAGIKKIEVLADWLERQMGDSSITDGRIMEEMGVANGTYYRWKPKASELLNKRITERQRVVEDTKTQEAVEAAKKGIKTKNERLLILQAQVDELLIDLTEDEISLTDKAYLRKTLKEIQAEISKMEGDYAPSKMTIGADDELKNLYKTVMTRKK